MKPGTVKRELALFNRIIKKARLEWDVPFHDNPMDRVTMPAVNDARDRRLTTGELQRLVAALDGTRNPLIKPVILFAIATALRRGEILNLEWRQIDFARRTAHIPHTKTGYARTIPLTDGALTVLGGVPRKGRLVFPLTVLALKQAWVRLVIRADVEDFHFHDCRHEAISRFAEMGLTTPELALISGHRDIRMLARYTHLRPTDLAAKLAGRSWETEGRPSVIPTQA